MGAEASATEQFGSGGESIAVEEKACGTCDAVSQSTRWASLQASHSSSALRARPPGPAAEASCSSSALRSEQFGLAAEDASALHAPWARSAPFSDDRADALRAENAELQRHMGLLERRLREYEETEALSLQQGEDAAGERSRLLWRSAILGVRLRNAQLEKNAMTVKLAATEVSARTTKRRFAELQAKLRVSFAEGAGAARSEQETKDLMVERAAKQAQTYQARKSQNLELQRTLLQGMVRHPSQDAWQRSSDCIESVSPALSQGAPFVVTQQVGQSRGLPSQRDGEKLSAGPGHVVAARAMFEVGRNVSCGSHASEGSRGALGASQMHEVVSAPGHSNRDPDHTLLVQVGHSSTWSHTVNHSMVHVEVEQNWEHDQATPWHANRVIEVQRGEIEQWKTYAIALEEKLNNAAWDQRDLRRRVRQLEELGTRRPWWLDLNKVICGGPRPGVVLEQDEPRRSSGFET